MILSVSTTCCFLPCGSAGTLEASLKSSCRGSHRRGTFEGLGYRGKASSDASVFRSRVGEQYESISGAVASFLSGFHPDSNNRGWLWALVCGPALLEDHLGFLKADRLPGDRVEEVDDAGHGRAHAAPAHHQVGHSGGVFSMCRPSSLTSLWPGPIDRGSTWDAASSSVGDWLALRSILLP
jgi:hypothetical protein